MGWTIVVCTLIDGSELYRHPSGSSQDTVYEVKQGLNQLLFVPINRIRLISSAGKILSNYTRTLDITSGVGKVYFMMLDENLNPPKIKNKWILTTKNKINLIIDLDDEQIKVNQD
eukprot:275435_1